MAYMLATRLASRRLLYLQTKRLVLTTGCRAYCEEEKCVQESLLKPNETHEERNKRLGRPLTPCLSIYTPHLFLFLSISHRITGCILSLYLWTIASYALFTPYTFTQLVSFIECMSPPTALLMFGKFAFAFPLSYHFCNGLRHLIWDTGRGLKRKLVTSSGLVVLTCAFVSTIGAIVIL